jgi:hypothetical protein
VFHDEINFNYKLICHQNYIYTSPADFYFRLFYFLDTILSFPSFSRMSIIIIIIIFIDLDRIIQRLQHKLNFN